MKSIGTFATAAFISLLGSANLVVANDGDRPISFGNWNGWCSKYSCLLKSNRSVLIDVDTNGYMIVMFPATPKQIAGISNLKVTLPDGTGFEDFKRLGMGNTLRMYVPEEHQKKFVEAKRFTVAGVGEIDIRNFGGLYKEVAFKLGIND